MNQREKRFAWLKRQTKATLINMILLAEDAESQQHAYSERQRGRSDKVTAAIRAHVEYVRAVLAAQAGLDND